MQIGSMNSRSLLPEEKEALRQMEDTSRKRKEPLVFVLVLGMMATLAALLFFRGARQNTAASLFAAIEKKDSAEVERLLKQGADVNTPRKDDKATPLLAASDRDLRIVQMLIDQGAFVEASDSQGRTPLLRAMTGWRLDLAGIATPGRQPVKEPEKSSGREIVRLLLAHGADINRPDANGETPLIIAVQMRRPDIVQFLLEQGALPSLITMAGANSSSIEGGSAIHYAAEYGRLDILKILLHKGVDINTRNIKQTPPLVLAARWGKLDCIRFLLEHGAAPNLQTFLGDTALTLAVQAPVKDQPAIVQALLEKDAKVNVRNSGGDTALILATQYGRTETVKLLLQRHADVKAVRVGKPKPLVFADMGRDSLTFGTLVSSPSMAPVSEVRTPGVPPAGMASSASLPAPRPPQKLSSRKLSRTHYFSIEGDTPLSYAAMYNRADVIRLLLEHGAAINQANTQGETPLHIAAAHGQPDAVRILLEKGGDPALKTNAGLTVLQLAEKMEQAEVLSLLKSTVP